VPTPALLTSMSTLPNSLMARDDRVAVAGIADVGPDGGRAPAFGFDKLAGVRQSASRRTGRHQVGTGLGQCLGERDTEAAGGAGDDRDTAVGSELVEGRQVRVRSGAASRRTTRCR
jgi:hypothetical protein